MLTKTWGWANAGEGCGDEKREDEDNATFLIVPVSSCPPWSTVSARLEPEGVTEEPSSCAAVAARRGRIDNLLALLPEPGRGSARSTGSIFEWLLHEIGLELVHREKAIIPVVAQGVQEVPVKSPLRERQGIPELEAELPVRGGREEDPVERLVGEKVAALDGRGSPRYGEHAALSRDHLGPVGNENTFPECESLQRLFFYVQGKRARGSGVEKRGKPFRTIVMCVPPVSSSKLSICHESPAEPLFLDEICKSREHSVLKLEIDRINDEDVRKAVPAVHLKKGRAPLRYRSRKETVKIGWERIPDNLLACKGDSFFCVGIRDSEQDQEGDRKKPDNTDVEAPLPL